jgi:DnaK suppressor protein
MPSMMKGQSTMNPQTLKRFREMFEQQKRNLAYTATLVNEDLKPADEDRIDEADLTSSELQTSMRIRLMNRESLFLKKINEALKRIDEGTFGECDSCGEEIELKRLEARPTATSCVHCKEEQERREQLHIDGRKHKSLGRALRLRAV